MRISNDRSRGIAAGHMIRPVVFAALIVAASSFFGLSSCASAPVTVPEGLSSAELVQRAQEASDKNDWTAALTYYQAVLDRYGDDLQVVCAAEYEIGFLKYKQKKWDEAKTTFKALLARYEGPDGLLLPAQYKVLADKVLAKIELEGH